MIFMMESDIQKLFGRKNKPDRSEVYELKITKTNRLPFARLAAHQAASLSNIDSAIGEYKKLSDMSADRKPYDSHFLINVPAYVCVCFYQPRKPKILYFIRIKDFLNLRDTSKMKSMTESEAVEISEKTLTL